MQPLNTRIEILIPSTCGCGQESVDAIERGKCITLVETRLSEWFGGTTAYPATGSWVDPTKQLIREPQHVVVSYTTSETERVHHDHIAELARQVCRSLHQCSVGVVFGGSFQTIDIGTHPCPHGKTLTPTEVPRRGKKQEISDLLLELADVRARLKPDAKDLILKTLFVNHLGFEAVSAPVGDSSVVAEKGGMQVVLIVDGDDHLDRHRTADLAKAAGPDKLLCVANAAGTEWAFIHCKPDGVVHRLVVEGKRPTRTVVERLLLLDQHDADDSAEVRRRVVRAFDVEQLTEDFYRRFRDEIFEPLRDHLRSLRDSDARSRAHEGALVLLCRLMLVAFLERRLLRDQEQGLGAALVRAYQAAGPTENTFYRAWLRPLFFDILDAHAEERLFPTGYPPDLRQLLRRLPYINGGLFKQTALDDAVDFSDKVLIQAIEFLSHHNLTVSEDTPFERDVAVNPEMIGKVFESLVFENEQPESNPSRGKEGGRRRAGVYYTPRAEIELMCRLSVADHLVAHVGEPARIVPFVFQPASAHVPPAAETDSTFWTQVLARIESISVLDPAVGSGSFLVGMLELLVDLRRRAAQLTGRDPPPEEVLRQDVVARNLFGVDVLPWAVHICELRLWLQMFSEERRPSHRGSGPLLPNLAFRIRVGDSLIQTVSKEVVLLAEQNQRLSATQNAEVGALADLRLRYYAGDRSASERDIFGRELRLYTKGVEQHLGRLRRERKHLASSSQQVLSRASSEAPGAADRERLTDVDAKIRTLSELKRRLGEQLPFVWEIGFSEVFQKEDPGFDIVIGNPPYVRQQAIEDLIAKRFSKDEYRGALADVIQRTWFHDGEEVNRRADLYVYFFFVGLSLLSSRGTLCFLTSSSWLDVDFGQGLRKLLASTGAIRAVLENRAKRSFVDADINTAIALLRKPGTKSARLACFVTTESSFDEIGRSDGWASVLGDAEAPFERRGGLRIVRRAQSTLSGGAIYAGGDVTLTPASDWWGGLLLRAPDVFHHILNTAGARLVPLGARALIERGITTNCNEFFYLEPVDPEAAQRAFAPGVRRRPSILRVRNGWHPTWEGEIERAYLSPILKDPKLVTGLRIPAQAIGQLIFTCRQTKTELGGTRALEYIRWGEQQGIPKRPSFKNKPTWWNLGVNPDYRAPLFFVKAVHEQARQGLVDEATLFDQRFYCLRPRGDEDEGVLAAFMNSTFFYLGREIFGRTNLGEGVLDTSVEDVKAMPIPDSAQMSSRERKRIIELFYALAKEVEGGRTIFEALDMPRCPRRVCDEPDHPWESVKRDRLKVPRGARNDLDLAILEALGVARSVQLDLYWGLVELLMRRLSRATSLSKGK